MTSFETSKEVYTNSISFRWNIENPCADLIFYIPRQTRLGKAFLEAELMAAWLREGEKLTNGNIAKQQGFRKSDKPIQPTILLYRHCASLSRSAHIAETDEFRPVHGKCVETEIVFLMFF